MISARAAVAASVLALAVPGTFPLPHPWSDSADPAAVTGGSGARAIAARPSALAPSPGVTAVVDLGEPLQDVLVHDGAIGAGPNGSSVIWVVSSGEGPTLSAVDPLTGAVVVDHALPAALGAWQLETTPRGEVYVSADGSSSLHRWTPEQGLVDLGAQLTSDAVARALVVSPDGMVHAATSPGGRVRSLDPLTARWLDHGQVADLDYLRSVAAAEDTILVSPRRECRVVALDRTTGISEDLPAPDCTGGASTGLDLEVAGDLLYARSAQEGPAPIQVYDLIDRRWGVSLPAVGARSFLAPRAGGEAYLLVDDQLQAAAVDGAEVRPTGVMVPSHQGARGMGWARLDDPEIPGWSVVGILADGTVFRYSPETGSGGVTRAELTGTAAPVTGLVQAEDGSVHVTGGRDSSVATLHAVTGERLALDPDGQVPVDRYRGPDPSGAPRGSEPTVPSSLAAAAGQVEQVRPDPWRGRALVDQGAGGWGWLAPDERTPTLVHGSSHDPEALLAAEDGTIWFSVGSHVYRAFPDDLCDVLLEGVLVDPVEVRGGTTCIRDAVAPAPITVRPGASLVASRATVGALLVKDGATAQFVDSAARGSVRVEGAGAFVVSRADAEQVVPDSG